MPALCNPLALRHKAHRTIRRRLPSFLASLVISEPQLSWFGFRHLRQKQSVVLVVSFTNPQEGRCPAKTFFTRSTKRRTRRWSLSFTRFAPFRKLNFGVVGSLQLYCFNTIDPFFNLIGQITVWTFKRLSKCIQFNPAFGKQEEPFHQVVVAMSE